MDEILTQEKPGRQRLFIASFILVVGILFANWQFGNPVAWILSTWWPAPSEEIAAAAQRSSYPPVLESTLWRGLTLHGRVPIEITEDIGRANPFLSTLPTAPDETVTSPR